MNATLGEGFRQIFLVVSADVDDKDFWGLLGMWKPPTRVKRS